MNAPPWHSSGDLELPGGLLQWRWSGQCSPAAIDTVAQQLQQQHDLLNMFLKKQEDIISLFIQGLVQQPGIAEKGDGQSMTDTRQPSKFGPSKFGQTETCFLDVSGGEGDRDIQYQASGSLSDLHHAFEGDNEHASNPTDSKAKLALGMAVHDIHLTRGVTVEHTITTAAFQINQGFRDKLIRWAHNWATLTEPPRRGNLAKLVKGFPFKATCVVVILINSAFTINSTNYAIDHRQQSEPAGFVIAEACFLTFYIIELIMKLLLHRLFFFCNSEMGWNIFDAIIILFSCSNSLLATSAGNSNLSFIRTFRILKLSKMFRIFRVISFFRDLRVMLTCVVNSFMSLVWCFVLLALIMVVFAIFFVQSLTTYAIEVEETGELPEAVARMIDNNFPSVQDAMVTLYMIVTGGQEWMPVYRGLEYSGGVNCAVLLFFIGFFHVSIFNIATGLFVDKALKYQGTDQDMEVLEHRREALHKVDKIKALCHALDLDKSGTIDRTEFMSCMKDPYIRYAFTLEGVDIKDTEAFFEVLAFVQGDQRISIDTFVAGCLRMRGMATSLDLQALGFEIKLQIEENAHLNQNILHSLSQLELKLDGHVQESHERFIEVGRMGRMGRRDPDFLEQNQSLNDETVGALSQLERDLFQIQARMHQCTGGSVS